MNINDFKTNNKAIKIKTVLIMFALFFFVAGLGRIHPSPFSFTLKSNDILSVVQDENGGVMVEKTSQTIYFFNAKHQIVAITDLSKEGRDSSRITGVEIENGQICLFESKLINGSSYIDYESVQAYTYKGKWIEEVERIDYEKEDHVTLPKLGSDYDVFTSDENSSEIVLSYSPAYYISNLLYWLSFIMVNISFIFVVIDVFRKKLLLRFRTAILAIAIAIATIGFYSLNSYQMVFDFYKTTISAETNQLSLVLENEYADKIEEIIASENIGEYFENKNNVDSFNEEQEKFITFLNSNDSEYNYFATVFILDPENNPDDLYAQGNKIYSYLDSRGLLKAGELIDYSNLRSKVSAKTYGDVRVVKNGVNSAMFGLRIIRNGEGKPIALLRVVARLSNITYKETNIIQSAIVSIVALFILVYVLFVLFGKYLKDIKRMIHRSKDDIKGKCLDMSGIYMFVFQIANTIDEIILVYAIANICSDMDIAAKALLITLPLSLNAVGRWAGTFIAGPLIKALGEGLAGFISTILATGSMLLMAYAITTSNIYLLAIGKLIQGIFIAGVMYVVIDTLPLNAESDEEKKEAMNHSQMSMNAAEILTALLSGYLAQYASYQAIYNVGAAMCILLLVITLSVFGKRKMNAYRESVRTENKSYSKNWLFFFKRPMRIFLVFYFIPYILIGGYKGYIFPLYAAQEGISVLLLSNISVYGKTLTFLLDDAVKKYLNRLSTTAIISGSLIIFSLGLMYFMFNPSIYWAIALYFIYAIVRRASNIGQKMYIYKTASDNGIDGKQFQSNFYTVNSAFYTLQSPMLSAFMSLGVSSGSAIVGFVCFAMTSIFTLLIKIKPKNDLN